MRFIPFSSYQYHRYFAGLGLAVAACPSPATVSGDNCCLSSALALYGGKQCCSVSKSTSIVAKLKQKGKYILQCGTTASTVEPPPPPPPPINQEQDPTQQGSVGAGGAGSTVIPADTGGGPFDFLADLPWTPILLAAGGFIAYKMFFSKPAAAPGGGGPVFVAR
jgi:hypothetical protein